MIDGLSNGIIIIVADQVAIPVKNTQDSSTPGESQVVIIAKAEMRQMTTMIKTA